MVKFLIILFAIFRPMKAAHVLQAAAAGLPDYMFLIFLIAFLTAICGYISINTEG